MEHSLWVKLRDEIGSTGDLTRIENRVGLGTPDVNGCIGGVEFWLENKWLERWPVRPNAIVKLPKFTQDQRVWLRRRAAAGGRVFLLLSVDHPRMYLLYEGHFAALNLGNLTAPNMLVNALVHSERAFPAEALLARFRGIR